MNISYRWAKGFFLTLIILMTMMLTSGCEAEKDTWERAKEINTIESYREYLQEHPEGDFSEEALWIIAELDNIAERYEEYLDLYPAGEYAGKAERALEELAEIQIWEEAISDNTLDSYEYYLTEYPAGIYAKEAEKMINELSTVISDDQRIGFSLQEIDKTKELPVGLADGFDLKAGYDFVIIEIEVSFIKEGHIQPRRGSVIYDVDNTRYPEISYIWEGAVVGDPTNITGTYELAEQAKGVFAFELPEGVKAVKFEMAYTFFESWGESWEKELEEERLIEIPLPFESIALEEKE